MPKIKIKSAPKAKSGKLIPLSSDMSLFQGPSHDNGGIDYKGIEVEGGEPLYQNTDGSQTVFGNLYVPGTNKKFKKVAKDLAKKDKKVQGYINKGNEILDNLGDRNTLDKWDTMKQNAGIAMLEGGALKSIELKKSKEHLASLQQALLETADDMGADPFQLSKGKVAKAKNGMKLKYDDGGTDPDPKKKSMAVRMNNPGNIKFGAFAKKYGAVKGDPATDGGYFAKFPDVEGGMKALKGLLKTDGYKNLSVDAAVKRWTNGSGYSVDYKNIKDKTVGSLSDDEFTKLVDTITSGEDGKYYQKGTTPPTTTKNTDPSLPGYKTPILDIFKTGKNKNTYNPRTVGTEDYSLAVKNPGKKDIPSNAKGLDWYQVAPELVAFAQNKVQPVWMQQFQPQLFQPTQVSFQDRMNDNQTSFNSLSKIMGNNPEALATLAAQKYSADNAVKGEEFRTNQQIEEDVTNKNIALLNDAQLKNIGLADTQFTRQEQAKSNTRLLNNNILNSITGKIAQNESRNQALKYYEALTDYRYNPESGQMEYMGDNMAEYLPTDNTVSGTPDNTATKKVLDESGNVKRTTYSTPSNIDSAIKIQQLQKGNYKRLQQILGEKGSVVKMFNSYKK